MESIIGKLGYPVDNSYLVDLTTGKGDLLAGTSYGMPKRLVKIASEPFKAKVQYGTYEFVIVEWEGRPYMCLNNFIFITTAVTGLNIYSNQLPDNSYNIFLVQDNYCHSLKLIKDTLEYARHLGLTVPDDDGISINILAGPRYKGVMSIEFNSITYPKGHKCWDLTPDSGLWEWLKY